MEFLDVISRRRSIRKFQNKEISRSVVEKLLQAAILAPSGKNRQPWQFVVLRGSYPQQLADVLIAKVEQLKKIDFPTGSALNSAGCIAQAAAVVVVYNPKWKPDANRNGRSRYIYSVDTQSVGAAIQNMHLAAVDVGLGGLWICDVFYAEPEISAWLGRTDELVAAFALGVADEDPPPRPRNAMEEITRWLED
jgi:nitroreductase